MQLKVNYSYAQLMQENINYNNWYQLQPMIPYQNQPRCLSFLSLKSKIPLMNQSKTNISYVKQKFDRFYYQLVLNKKYVINISMLCRKFYKRQNVWKEIVKSFSYLISKKLNVTIFLEKSIVLQLMRQMFKFFIMENFAKIDLLQKSFQMF